MSAADPRLPRLAPGGLTTLPTDVRPLRYDRGAQRTGIVHFGIGAFHRAHQAVYTDDAMAEGDRNWRILGVSLRSPAVREQTAPQDGLYTVTERDPSGDRTALVGAVGDVIVAPHDPQAVVAALASPDTHIVSFTITEKGYHRRLGGGLDFTAPAVASDRDGETSPQTIYGFLRAGLAARRVAGLSGLTLLSCDNLASNGSQLAACVSEFLESADPELARWFASECASPSTMVDRIVPATTGEDLTRLASHLGQRDEGAVFTEPFRQWVIEENFAGARPRWETGGAEFVSDVHAYELAKLRMLNGAHSALAYLGLGHGCRYVHEAIATPDIRAVVEQLMRAEAAPTLPSMPGFDANRYADRLLARFANSALPHSLAQIAMDGSQKIPQRWLAVLADRSAAALPCPALLTALAGWMKHVRRSRDALSDPMAGQLTGLARGAGNRGLVEALVGPSGLFVGTWTASAAEIDALTAKLSEG